MMELRVLKYFLAVAREENITRAAAMLHLTQPTLSRQLMQLEEELGVQLFHRGKYRVTLTEDGMLLRRRAQELVELEEKTRREFRRDEQLRGEISIGSGDLEAMSCLSKILGSFHQLHPQVKYQLYSGNSDNIKERIEQGLLDLGLLMEPVEISKYDFVRLPAKEQWGVLVREDSPLAAREFVTAGDLEKMPLILSRRELVLKELEHWFGERANRMEIVASGNLPYNMAILAREGIGVLLTVKLRCIYEGLRFIPLSPPIESGTVLVWKKAETFPPVLNALVNYIKNAF
ncbi:LysR family transcriptional regulator [Angelakisella massiliensis]|uniref:LysR family transcriptional regulator n=1 Tax=Angelakisella massiliensis TaxID=1871018 RepID=UPI0030B8110F